MVSHVSEQKSCHDWLLNEVHSPYDTIVIFYENRRMPQGTRLTELEQGKILAYKDSGMSIHQIAKKN